MTVAVAAGVRQELCGVLNIRKPVGMTSHDVVARIRRLAGQRSVGHAGTLDPLASGVLVLLLGKATVLAEWVTAGEKAYEATFVFGRATTTDDAEGETCRETAVPNQSSDELISFSRRFVGEIEQIPPRFSAVQRDGKRAYAVARAGGSMEIPARRVNIHSIDILSWNPPELRLNVTCGPGTYIRSLARDMGEALQSSAYMHELVRTRSGGFRLDDAHPLDLMDRANLNGALLPPETAVASLRCVVLDESQARRVRHGLNVDLAIEATGPNETVRLHDDTGALIALARPKGEDWHGFRVLDVGQ